MPADSDASTAAGRVARRTALLVLFVLAATPSAVACRGAESGARTGERSFNLILFSLDTLRADYVDRSPRLGEMARQGRWFTGARASANWTLPSHVSLFTSQSYLEHQVPPPGFRPPFAGFGIASGQATLAAAVSAAGYYTAGSTEGGYVSDAFGFGLGFNEYREIDPDDGGGRGSAAARIAAHVAQARRAVAQARGRPLFLFVHSYLAHDYFTNAADYRGDIEGFGRELLDHGSFIEDIRRGRRGPGHGLPTEYLRALYERGVELADRLLASVVNEVLEATGNAPLLVVVTSDHGESLGDLSADGATAWWHHGGALPPSQVRVPLILWSSTGAGEGEVFAPPVSTIDIAPSVLARLGVPVPEVFRGRSDLFGEAPPVPERPVPTPVLAGNYVAHATEPFRGRIESLLFEGGLEYFRSDSLTGESLVESCALSDDEGPGERSASAAVERTSEASLEPPGLLPIEECVRLRSTLSRLIAETHGAALVVRADGAVTIALAPEEPTTGIFAVRSSVPSPGPLLDPGTGTIRWTATAAEDVLVLIPRSQYLRIDRIQRGEGLVAETVTPLIDPLSPATLLGGPGGGWLSLTPRFRPQDPSAAASLPAALLERLRGLGYLR